MVLDTKLGFSLHQKNVRNKMNKTIELNHKVQNTLPRLITLITLFKSFIRSHLGHGDIIYDRV